MATKMYTVAEVLSRVFRLDRKAQQGTLSTTPGKINGRTLEYEDTSFVTGDSPVVLDVNTDLGRNAVDGYITNDGPGDMKVEISDDGTNYGGQHTMRREDVLDLRNLEVAKIRIAWVADTAYRVLVI